MTLESNFETREQLEAVLKARGYEPDPESTPTPASPGESPSGKAPASETVPVVETGKETQVTQAAPTVEGEPKTATPEAKFEPRRKQLERKVERLHEDLDLERGSKAALQVKLDAAQAELAKLKPAEPEPKTVELAKPKRPTRAECDYDDDKHEAAMDKYETDLAAYNAAVIDKTVTDRLAANAEAETKRALQAEADAIFDAFVKRRDEQKASIDGYEELREAAGDLPISPILEEFLIRSEFPAALFAFFYKDMADNEGKELARYERIPEVLRVRELTKLELKLAEESKGGKAPKEPKKPAEAKTVETAAPVATEDPKPQPVQPARQQPKIEDAPLEPLGGRSGGRTPSLKEAKTPKEYIAMRNQGIVR